MLSDKIKHESCCTQILILKNISDERYMFKRLLSFFFFLKRMVWANVWTKWFFSSIRYFDHKPLDLFKTIFLPLFFPLYFFNFSQHFISFKCHLTSFVFNITYNTHFLYLLGYSICSQKERYFNSSINERNVVLPAAYHVSLIKLLI